MAIAIRSSSVPCAARVPTRVAARLSSCHLSSRSISHLSHGSLSLRRNGDESRWLSSLRTRAGVDGNARRRQHVARLSLSHETASLSGDNESVLSEDNDGEEDLFDPFAPADLADDDHMSLAESMRELDDQLSRRPLDLDPAGYFIIYVDREQQCLVAQHYGNLIDSKGRACEPVTGKPIPCDGSYKPTPLRVYRGRTAKEVSVMILEQYFGPGEKSRGAAERKRKENAGAQAGTETAGASAVASVTTAEGTTGTGD
ncbi:unnamed protein product [Closterium sp. NIES-64]|nr:unnamed protein product [Closterium sp. NIES-64]